MDHATCYSAAAIVKTKHREDIVKAIFQIWITLSGHTKEVLSHNGVGFKNELL